MATIYDGGLTKSHDSMFGIKHKNIAPILSKNNWSKKAIVRGGCYIFIKKYVKYDTKTPKHKIIIYKIKGLIDEDKCNKDYLKLELAIKSANNHSNGKEGILPRERYPSIGIHKVYMSKNIKIIKQKESYYEK